MMVWTAKAIAGTHGLGVLAAAKLVSGVYACWGSVEVGHVDAELF